ncbi:UpxY family transcription antiterminator [Flavihumibacter petaseus]|uniref:Putative transcription antitermination factor n=1 Tax=Flavihumibacter petaseus NBRC 106054 TaxID=1220578 RepID=A0A0E9N693_9BACT|nr:UpxY family transcription antiterminator [Flavihumibacter petaseus]GAO45231.1 putative transcription antitermination factor [Flavihumibacter petaseus NBRC 106054]
MSDGLYWFAVYTKPRWEKKVFALLKQKGIIAYCPLTKVRKKWSDRFKVIEEPLFKSYVFVKVSPEHMTNVRMVDGIVNFVYWLGKPAKIAERDIDKIKRFLEDNSGYVVQWQPAEGEQVIITGGAFMDQEAVVLAGGKKVSEVLLVSLGFKLVAYVDNIKLLRKDES